MTEIIFTASLGTILAAVYLFSFRNLADERWQVFASVPVHKREDGSWRGVNITYYGLLTATGYTLALTIFAVMLISAGVAPLSLLIILLCILAVFVPSAKIMAYIIERKKHTITVGGAVFAMLLLAPWIVISMNRVFALTGNMQIPEIAVLSSLITAYAFGEGFGRLACISFGCCYGKPLRDIHPLLRKIFSKLNFVYSGRTKKISYHDGLDGIEIFPVQGVTAVIYTLSGLAGLWLFLSGSFYASFMLSLAVTQLWRFLSEFLRADFRGGSGISAYQIMSLLIVPYYIPYMFLSGIKPYPAPDLISGISFIWSPGIILLLAAMWTGCVLYTGVSSVTTASISISVNKERI